MFKKGLLCVSVLAVMLNMCVCGMQTGVILGDNAAQNELAEQDDFYQVSIQIQSETGKLDKVLEG